MASRRQSPAGIDPSTACRASVVSGNNTGEESAAGPPRGSGADNVTDLPNGSGTNCENREQAWPSDWRAYICLLGGFLLMFNSWGIVNAYGTFASYYTEALLPGEDILKMNLIGSTQSFVILLLSAPVGRFLDAGHVRILLVIGTILLSIGYFTLSVANGDGGIDAGNYGLTWFTQGFMSSLGMACLG